MARRKLTRRRLYALARRYRLHRYWDTAENALRSTCARLAHLIAPWLWLEIVSERTVDEPWLHEFLNFQASDQHSVVLIAQRRYDKSLIVCVVNLSRAHGQADKARLRHLIKEFKRGHRDGRFACEPIMLQAVNANGLSTPTEKDAP